VYSSCLWLEGEEVFKGCSTKSSAGEYISYRLEAHYSQICLYSVGPVFAYPHKPTSKKKREKEKEIGRETESEK